MRLVSRRSGRRGKIAPPAVARGPLPERRLPGSLRSGDELALVGTDGDGVEADDEVDSNDDGGEDDDEEDVWRRSKADSSAFIGGGWRGLGERSCKMPLQSLPHHPQPHHPPCQHR